MKRVKVIKENPNGLFLQWLAEFREEAREKGNSGLIKVYKMCIENLSKYVFFSFINYPGLIAMFSKVPASAREWSAV